MHRLLSSITMALLLCACTPPQQSLLSRQALCVPIGLKGQALDLCVLNIENSKNSYRFNTYYIVDDGHISDVDGLGGGFQTYELLVSPSRRDLAIVADAGEGHRYFTVVNLDHIRRGIKPGSTASIEAYPNGFYNLHWQGDRLAFTTETNLTPVKSELVDFEQEYSYRYLLDPVSGIIEQIGEPALLEPE